MRPYHIVNALAGVVMTFIVGAIVCAQKDRTIAHVTAEYHNAR